MGSILQELPPQQSPNLLVGYGASDDGAVYKLDQHRHLIQTVDFFTPVVDDPETFGAIAAANALSDVYAMGGRPLTALAIVCYPYKTWPADILAAIMRGADAKVREAGAHIVGGHSVVDQEIKFGLAVTGTAERYWQNCTPEPYDALVLTKPLGTGLLTTAAKKDLLPQEVLTEPIREMARLNARAANLARHYDIHAATDITGFGLIGHLYEMLKPKGLGANIHVEKLPLFDHVWEAVKLKAFTGAHTTNREYVADYDIPLNPAHETFGQILYDPQTSGGLLLALPQDQAQSLVDQLTADHHAAIIGSIKSWSSIEVDAKSLD